MTQAVLADFVHSALRAGASRVEIESALAAAGWSQQQIADGFRGIADVVFVVPVPRPQPQLSARDAFLYLVTFGALYLSAYYLGNLLFQFVNLAFPDELFHSGAFVYGQIRWGIAALMVAFPIFLYLSYRMSRDVAVDGGRKASPVRRWLTYTTLVVAAFVIIGDLISLIYSLLSGELTVRFVLKSAIVALLAGSIFGYYLWLVRADDRALTRVGVNRLAAWLSSIVVVVVLLAGLMVSGSPLEQRYQRLDERRTADLRQLVVAIGGYWAEEGGLPGNLDALVDGRRISRLPADPVTGAKYGYEVAAPDEYRLCARFDRASSSEDDGGFWAHAAGLQCFSFQASSGVSPGALRRW